MDGLKIDQKIRFGYYKAAQKLGRPTKLYRSATAFDPLNPANLIGTLPMVVTQDFTWMKSTMPGDPYRFLFIDGRSSTAPLSAEEMDYLVDADATYFVLSKEYQLPMQAVYCNSTVKVIRPTQSKTGGVQPRYSAYTPLPPDILTQMDKVPCSILMKTSGEKAPSKLPTDVREPAWIILMPRLGGVILKTGDIIMDEVDRSFTISTVEITDFGFRMTSLQQVN